MQALSRSAKILSGLITAAFWLLIAWAVFYGGIALRSALAIGLGNPSGTLYVSGITLDYLFLDAADGLEIPHRSYLVMNFITMGHYFLEVPLMCRGLQLLRKTLACMEQQRPFSGTAALLRKLGWLSAALSVLSNLLKAARIYASEHVYGLEALFVGDTISAVGFRFRPDYTFVVVTVVLFLLSAVFRYGEELQQLSDETL